jgi:hypothetical protein
MTTSYHSQYFAYELTRRCSSRDLQKLNQSIFNATVDLNPHQIDAALFAFQSPLSRGALLADEVGLGKTIEAGLIISQLWAERKRRILCIVPAALRPQWSRELLEKFFINSVVMDSRVFRQYDESGTPNPLDQPDKILICSYHFARAHEDEIKAMPWDLVAIDEAHRLRNVYRKDNKIARSIKAAIETRPKVLLTATPLQNSLLELYGLVGFIDPHIFGSIESFRGSYAWRATDMTPAEFQSLKKRINPICQRTLRRQVTEYIRYTNRIPITQDFTPSDDEVLLYEEVSSYLQRPTSYALPKAQRSLMTLILRKILASSSFAITETLGTMITRLELLEQTETEKTVDSQDIVTDYDPAQELSDEWAEDEDNGTSECETSAENAPNSADKERLEGIRNELKELQDYKELAERITRNAKGDALLLALRAGFESSTALGSPRKALIFTESRRTQRYLKDLLSASEYKDQIITLSGTNDDDTARAIHREWRERHRGQDFVTGSYDVDVRTALVDAFEKQATIMIATESGAEGLNLQFCSLVVNYDLPWNPQRIEQRIGRCHRYGQKHDVVVINFINRRNAADQRVFELLSEKFHLFSGIFGASDEILGSIGSGVDFEKRINEIYQACRTPDEINTAFDKLQQELEDQINVQLAETRSQLMEHFDDEVRERLRLSRQETETQVDRFGNWLWQLTKNELAGCATFADKDFSFDLHSMPLELDQPDMIRGRYRLITKQGDETAHHYRIGHPLAQCLLSRARERVLPCKEVILDYEAYEGKIAVVEALKGLRGWLQLSLLSVDALEREEHVIFSAVTDDGKPVDHDVCRQFFKLKGHLAEDATLPSETESRLTALYEKSRAATLSEVTERHQQYFEDEMEKLELWADDLKEGLEREIKELDKEIRATRKEARCAPDLDTKVSLHRRVRDMEKQRNDKRKRLFDAQDEVDTRKEGLIGDIEARLKQRVEEKTVFTLRWVVV